MTQPTIHSLRVRAVHVPVDPPVQTAAGSIGVAPLVLLDLLTSDGVTGSAYVFTYTPAALGPVAALAANMEALVRGQPAAPLALNRQLAARFHLLGKQGLVGMALSLVDMAAWDAHARGLGVSLSRLLGAAGDEKLPAYASLRGITAGQLAEEVEAAAEHGFQAFKIKLGHSTARADTALVGALRGIVGPDAHIMVDYNQALSLPEALHRAAILDDHGVAWIEEPLRADDYAGHATVAQATRTPIQVGENFWGPHEVARSIAAGGSDLLMPDVMKIGGVTGWTEAAALAAAAGLPVSSHLFVEFSSHLMAATPVRHLVEWLDFAAPILSRGTPRIEGGCVLAGSAPGAGIEWDEAAVARYAA